MHHPRLNGIWPFTAPINPNSSQSMIAQLQHSHQFQLLLQQQLQQQQQQQQEMYASYMNSGQKTTNSKFNSPFSVNNLLAGSQPVERPPLPSPYQQHQQMAAVFGQHLVSAIENYRYQNQKSAFQQSTASPTNSAKKFKPPQNDSLYEQQVAGTPNDTSVCSISSSPSSSSATSLSFDYSHHVTSAVQPDQYHQSPSADNSENNLNMVNQNVSSERDSPDLLSTSSSVSSCSSSASFSYFNNSKNSST